MTRSTIKVIDLFIVKLETWRSKVLYREPCRGKIDTKGTIAWIKQEVVLLGQILNQYISEALISENLQRL